MNVCQSMITSLESKGEFLMIDYYIFPSVN